MDHFFTGAFIRRRVQFMGKSQLFKGIPGWIFSHGGVFPVRRGHQDEEAFITADRILSRGGAVVMYCEGGRSRSGKIADEARPGIGRIALESGAPVVPVAILGSYQVRNWKRLQFPKVTVQYGEPFRFEVVNGSTREQQQEVADYILDRIRELHGELARLGRRGAARAARPRALGLLLRGRARGGGRGDAVAGARSPARFVVRGAVAGAVRGAGRGWLPARGSRRGSRCERRASGEGGTSRWGPGASTPKSPAKPDIRGAGTGPCHSAHAPHACSDTVTRRRVRCQVLQVGGTASGSWRAGGRRCPGRHARWRRLRGAGYAVAIAAASPSPSSSIAVSRILNFCTLPVTVIGNESTSFT